MKKKENEEEEFLQNASVLARSDDRQALARAAVVLAGSAHPQAQQTLGSFLRRREFLARLDNLSDVHQKTYNLRAVLEALRSHPTPVSASICVTLANDPAFLEEPDRLIWLLPALSAVRPMSEEGAELFLKTNNEGFFAGNAPLLVANGSERALSLFESMIRDSSVDPESRIDAVHNAVLPHRTDAPVLESAGRLLGGGLAPEVETGVVETLFDFQYRRWFGPAIGAPRPPAWESGSDEALQLVLRLADRVKSRRDLPAELADAVNRTAAEVRDILAARKK